jgi:hypothetical protein
VTIEISSDETLVTSPKVNLTAPANALAPGVPSLVATNTWQLIYSSPVAGSYVATVSGLDAAGNTGTSDEYTFEVDTSLPDPATDPEDGAEITNRSPFITIDFTAEGAEYDGDTHKKVTITKATLDGEDISGQLGTTDNVRYIYKAENLSLGEHTLVVNGQDEAGNSLAADLTVTFTVKAKPKYEVPLVPGMNLFSLPGEPADTSIDAVFGALPVDLVVTYDPFHPAGPWLVAQKGADGKFTGTLETIDASHAYWVRSTGFTPISVDIPDRPYQQLPPAIPVAKGWNLVPVVDPALNAAGTDLKGVAGYADGADDYFASISWSIGYTYDTQTNTWIRLRKGAADSIIVGKGYWVYVTTAGELVP